MTLFIGSFLIILACCGLMMFTVNVSGKPLPGGCGKDVSDSASCQNCPHRILGQRACPDQGEIT